MGLFMKLKMIGVSAIVFICFLPLSVLAEPLIVTPNVVGLTVLEAKENLQAFRVEVVWSAPAPSKENALVVHKQSVPPNVRLRRGDKIVLTAFDDYIPLTNNREVDEGLNSLEALFGIIDSFSAQENKKRVENEKANEGTGQSVRGDEPPPGMKRK